MLVILHTFFLHMHSVRVKRHTLKPTYTFGLGLIAFFVCAILFITGGLLMFYYLPSVSKAYSDIVNLRTSVPFGDLLRNAHRWGAHILVLVIILHGCRVFFTGSYKQPREFNWVIGVMLFVVTLLLSFTGYLLPWDQLSYWAVTVASEMAGYAPFIGDQVKTFLLGGREVGQDTLVRFYAFHIFLLPTLLVLLLGLHFWRIRKDGGLSAPADTKGGKGREDTLFSWPHLLVVEALVFLGVCLFLLFLSAAVDAPLRGIANPDLPENPSKAPWFFLNLQELLLHMNPSLAGVIIPVILILLLMVVPYIDRHLEDVGIWFAGKRGKKIALWSALYTAPLLVGLIIFDAFVGTTSLVSHPEIVPGWLIPVATMGVLSLGLYSLLRPLRPSMRETLIAYFTAFATTYFILTVIGLFFRGEGMALILPWKLPGGGLSF
jgi:quinol-cytochrome oxidoreductase complex cytochrome b subunit